ncbi:DUF859 domain-containing protein [Streptococcus infantarius]|uniref:DUF859 family phage minor structural protein n=1 Tax=Streptococcus infantarius TaxID=102684 RepID=UPI002284989A|nr:DUF859 family phage minor structural protein [Streptococcus infantarius]MCY7237890.1 DUF859 domain-containing protein [Streptococcus infantarius]
MATAQFSGQYGRNMTLELKADVTGQNFAGNYSSVRVTAYLHTNGYASLWGVSADATITINGGGAIEHPSINIGTNSVQQIWDHTYNIGHNDDGYKTVGIMLSVGINVAGYGSAMVAFDLPLPTIPRASSGSVTSGDLGTPVKISIDRKVSTFKHTLRYDWNGITGTIASNVDTSYNWTLPLDFASAIPNATSSWGRVFIDTYNGSTKIGTTEATFTGNVPASMKPTLSSVTLTDTNTAVKNLLNTANTFVQVLSNVQVTFNGASGAYGSTISSYRAEILGKNQNTNSNNSLLGMMNFNGAVTIRATITDSRGRTSDPVDVQATVLEYFTPQLSFSAQRSGSGNTTITVMRNAKIAPLVVGGNQKNTMKLTFKYKEHSATSFTIDTGSAGGTWTTISNLTNSSANLGATFSVLKSYDIIGTIEDSFTSYEFLAPTVGTESFPFALKVDRMGLGKLPEQAGIVDSAWQYYYDNKPIQHHQVTSDDGKALLLPDGTNLDTIVDAGFYNVTAPLNSPTGSDASTWKYIRVSCHTYGTGYILQEAIDFNGVVSAYRVKNGGTWKPWQYYAVQNTVANFTAVNQTKVYTGIINGPFGFNIAVTRSGNVVTATMDYIHRSNTNWSGTANETIPVGWRPVSQAIINAIGEGGAGTGASLFNGSYVHLAYKPDGSISGRIKLDANPLWFGATISWITTDPFPAE